MLYASTDTTELPENQETSWIPAISALGHVAPKQRKVKPSIPKTGPSLKPGNRFISSYTARRTEERDAVLNAWRFSFPVTKSRTFLENTDVAIIPTDQVTSRGKDTRNGKPIRSKS